MSTESKPRSEANWFLVGKLAGAGVLQRLPVSPLPYSVGRQPGASLCIPAAHISKAHAEFFERDDQLWLRDMGSTNGTYLNGQRVDGGSPLTDGDMIQFASEVFRLQLNQTGSMPNTINASHRDRAMLLLQLDRLLVDRDVMPHFQPIVSLTDDSVFGYEVLGRTRLFGLETPKTIFEVAGMFDLERQVSELFRSAGICEGARLPGIPNLFVNTHPTELGTPELLDSMRFLREVYPNVPLTLEIHEAAVTCPAEIAELQAQLREMNVLLAYDDFGAGQSRLLELIEVPPDFIKFDMGFIRQIDTASATRQNLLESLVRMVQSLGIASLAEGIETTGEAAVCRQLGFDFAQGYFFGRPCEVQHIEPLEADRPTDARACH